MKLLSAACIHIAIVSTLGAAAIAAVPGPANADVYNYWGAIAVSLQTSNTGASWNYSSAAAADAVALNECGVADCQVYVELRMRAGLSRRQPTGPGVGVGVRLYPSPNRMRSRTLQVLALTS
jgi:Domain of unknown function (DUF4189)